MLRKIMDTDQAGGKIVALGSGKGGVGKSFLAANMGIHIAGLSKKVILVDADLGNANLHTYLDLPLGGFTLSDFIAGRVSPLTLAASQTRVPNLFLIPGGKTPLGAANIVYKRKIKLLKAIKRLPADFIILDLGTGVSFNVLDFFLIAHHKVVIARPEPASIENFYQFIKTALWRRLTALIPDLKTRKRWEASFDQEGEWGVKGVTRIISQAGEGLNGGIRKRIEEELSRFKVNLVLNWTTTPADRSLGYSIEKVCKGSLGVALQYLGYIDFDLQVGESTRLRQPFILKHPDSGIATAVRNITNLLLIGYER